MAYKIAEDLAAPATPPEYRRQELSFPVRVGHKLSSTAESLPGLFWSVIWLAKKFILGFPEDGTEKSE